MSTTGFVHHPACIGHDPGPGHPEQPERLRAVLRRIESSGLEQELQVVRGREATDEELSLVHPERHIGEVREACGIGARRLDVDTSVSAGSWSAALRAAGGILDAVERVHDGTWDNAFCALRPPGHHAEREAAMGFCLFNNVAIAAEALRAKGVERVAIVDFDVHHGNGTQHLFEEDPHVFYASLHQWPLYPGTGAAHERGRGAGEGTTLNCPLDAGTRDADWQRALENQVLPALESFRPDFLLVSAGFDAHRADPLGSVELTEDGFRGLTDGLLDLARRSAGGKLVSVLEGGYDLSALASSVEAHVGRLAGAAPCSD